MYRVLALGGTADGVHLVDDGELAAMGAVASATLGRRDDARTDALGARLREVRRQFGATNPATATAWSSRRRRSVTSGMGGSIGFADPRARLSFGYTMNRQGMAVGLDDRAQSLIDATYAALGYRRSPRGGSWFPRSRSRRALQSAASARPRAAASAGTTRLASSIRSADRRAPSSARRTISYVNVENVVYAPQKPVPRIVFGVDGKA